MGIQIVLNQRDLFRVCEVRIGQFLQYLGIIQCGMAIGDFYMPPALKAREHHEHIGRAVPPVFVIVSNSPPRFRGDGNTRFSDQLL